MKKAPFQHYDYAMFFISLTLSATIMVLMMRISEIIKTSEQGAMISCAIVFGFSTLYYCIKAAIVDVLHSAVLVPKNKANTQETPPNIHD
jgi:hypothetical protein